MTQEEKNLPLSIRVQVRDLWNASASPVRTALASLEHTLGVAVYVECNWITLFEAGRSLVKNEEEFVPKVAQLVEAWALLLEEFLGDCDGEDWVENLVGAVSQAQELRLFVAPYERNAPMMEWRKDRTTFKLRCSNDVYYEPRHNLKTEFNAMRSEIDRQKTPLPEPSHPLLGTNRSDQSIDQFHGSIESLPSPEVLFKSRPPYYLTVRQVQDGIEIESSHEPSLELIKKYFTKYLRPDRNHNAPIYDFRMLEAFFGRGTLFDRLLISPSHIPARRPQNAQPTLQLIAFVEGVLGYSPLDCAGFGAGHHFRRTSPFI